MPLGAFIQQIRKRFESSLPRIRILPRSGRKNQTPVLEGAAQSAADGKPEGVPDGGRGFDVRREGFEPSKAEPVDLQSTPFDRFGTCANYFKLYILYFLFSIVISFLQVTSFQGRRYFSSLSVYTKRKSKASSGYFLA